MERCGNNGGCCRLWDSITGSDVARICFGSKAVIIAGLVTLGSTGWGAEDALARVVLEAMDRSKLSCPSLSNCCSFRFVIPCITKRQSPTLILIFSLNLSRETWSSQRLSQRCRTHCLARSTDRVESMPHPTKNWSQSNPLTLKQSGLGTSREVCLREMDERSRPTLRYTYSTSLSLRRSMGTETLLPFNLCRHTSPCSKERNAASV